VFELLWAEVVPAVFGMLEDALALPRGTSPSIGHASGRSTGM
jgi:hypothetical protein